MNDLAATDLIAQVIAELDRAFKKFPTWPTDPLHALAVLGEEYGELTKAMLQRTYEPGKASDEDIREEAMQTAAMAIRLAMSLDRYKYDPCDQHDQGSSARACGFRMDTFSESLIQHEIDKGLSGGLAAAEDALHCIRDLISTHQTATPGIVKATQAQ